MSQYSAWKTRLVSTITTGLLPAAFVGCAPAPAELPALLTGPVVTDPGSLILPPGLNPQQRSGLWQGVATTAVTQTITSPMPYTEDADFTTSLGLEFDDAGMPKGLPIPLFGDLSGINADAFTVGQSRTFTLDTTGRVNGIPTTAHTVLTILVAEAQFGEHGFHVAYDHEVRHTYGGDAEGDAYTDRGRLTYDVIRLDEDTLDYTFTSVSDLEQTYGGLTELGTQQITTTATLMRIGI